jgi:hypothetical protein
MKHAREDYNRIQDPAGLIAEDEPVMLFRAKDAYMPYVLRYYAETLDEIGGQQEKLIQAVLNHAEAAKAWQKVHGCKDPDIP